MDQDVRATKLQGVNYSNGRHNLAAQKGFYMYYYEEIPYAQINNSIRWEVQNTANFCLKNMRMNQTVFIYFTRQVVAGKRLHFGKLFQNSFNDWQGLAIFDSREILLDAEKLKSHYDYALCTCHEMRHQFIGVRGTHDERELDAILYAKAAVNEIYNGIPCNRPEFSTVE